jgi:hypothetical protein
MKKVFLTLVIVTLAMSVMLPVRVRAQTGEVTRINAKIAAESDAIRSKWPAEIAKIQARETSEASALRVAIQARETAEVTAMNAKIASEVAKIQARETAEAGAIRAKWAP